jgi:KDO2-lipid IV(A) lauroyltransferase
LSVSKRWRWRAEYLALRGVYRLAETLPWRALPVWGRRIGLAVYRTAPIRKQVVLANLRGAFGSERSGAEIDLLAREFYANLGITVLEFCSFGKMDADRLREVTVLEGLEHLVRCRAAGSGALLVSGHFGNWELMGASVTARGYPVKFLIKTQSNPWVDRLQNDTRAAAGLGVIRPGLALREMVHVLRRGDFIGLLGDQDAGRDGLFVDFLGRPASVFRGPAYLAYRLGCPIIFGHITRHRDGRHRVTLEPPLTADPAWDETTAVARLTAAHVAILERVIRRSPEHYWWLHRRWKTRPEPPAG